MFQDTGYSSVYGLQIWYCANCFNQFVYEIKESVSSSIPCTCHILVGLCLSPFSWPLKKATNKGQPRDETCNHFQKTMVLRILDGTDPSRSAKTLKGESRERIIVDKIK